MLPALHFLHLGSLAHYLEFCCPLWQKERTRNPTPATKYSEPYIIPLLLLRNHQPRPEGTWLLGKQGGKYNLSMCTKDRALARTAATSHYFESQSTLGAHWLHRPPVTTKQRSGSQPLCVCGTNAWSTIVSAYLAEVDFLNRAQVKCLLHNFQLP